MCFRFLHNLKHKAIPRHFLNQRPAVAALRPDMHEEEVSAVTETERLTCPVAVSDARWRNPEGKHKAFCIYRDVTLASFDALADEFAAVKAPASAPFSVVLTLWLSMMAAEGNDGSGRSGFSPQHQAHLLAQ